MGVEEKRIVYLSQNSITGQTFHWHDELELLLVAEGSLNLKVGYEEFLLPILPFDGLPSHALPAWEYR